MARNATVVEFKPGILEIKSVELRRPADGDEHLVKGLFATALPAPGNTTSRPCCRRSDIDAHMELDIPRDNVHQRLVHPRTAHICQTFASVEETYLHAEMRKGLRQLQADRPCPHHGQRCRQILQLEYGLVCQSVRSQISEGTRHGWCRPCCDHD